MPKLTELEVARATAGDTAALRRVYEVLAPALEGYLRARGSDDPAGLTQDVFVALLPRLGQLSGGVEGLRTLAFSIAHARLVDENRRRAKRPPVRSYEPADDPRVVASAEESALSRVEAAEVVNLLAGLSEDQRTVVALRVLGELSLEETATVIGRSVGAVKQLQRRGLLALQERAREGVTP